MKNILTPILCAATLAMVGCGGSSSDAAADSAPAKSTVAFIGDVPYGATPTDTSETLAHPAFLKAINADADASLVIHVGDIHSGSQYCTQAYDLAIANDYKLLTKPLVYTPGDNEWTDCNKAKQGGGTYNAATGKIDYLVDSTGNYLSYAAGDPLINLDLVRAIFFAKPGKTLGVAMDVHSQAIEYDTANPTDASYVENVWFEKSGVLFVTANLPGGSNNDTDPWYAAPTMSPAQAQEVANRSAAIKRWLDAAFKRAVADNTVAMVIGLQADMWYLDGKTASHIAQYKQFIDQIATAAKAYGKPVLLVNGDSHIYRSDNPLVPGAACVTEPSSGAAAVACTDDAYTYQPNGYNVPNFHRIVVHGSTTPLEWLKVAINPQYDPKAAATATTFGPFSWQRMQPAL